MIAKVAVSAAVYAIDKPYSYCASEELHLRPGVRVMVPFGHGNRRCEGIVLRMEQGSADGLKWIDAVLDEEPVMDDAMLRLAAFVRERYFCTFYEAIRAVLPVGLWFEMRDTYTLDPDAPWKKVKIRQKDAALILSFLETLGGSGSYTALRKCIEDEERMQAAVRYLLNKKWITAQTDMLRRVRDKTERIAVLCAPAEEAMDYARRVQRSAPVQSRTLQMLCALGICSAKELCYFTGATYATLRRLEKLEILTLESKPALRVKPLKPAERVEMQLNKEQAEVFCGLDLQMQEERPGVALLYGVTGSGKTAVYLHLIQTCLRRGKSAMLLVPEIALTPQLISLLSAWFGDAVSVLHSSLPVGERYDQWKRIRAGGGRVVVGTRSAVFAPCSELGLIILDEEQEHTYKSENAPRYHAREVAIYRGDRSGALVLLGSATPSVETMYRARSGMYRLYTIRRRFNSMALPAVEIVDMKQEIRAGCDSLISRPLQQEIRANLDLQQQTILFLNRRGASRLVVCVDCGEVPQCPRCSVHMTYHSANGRLMCHYCGHSEPMPRRCPKCGGAFKLVGAGTQMVQQELEMLFPGVEVLRMDADTVSAVNNHEKMLNRFQRERIPILLGTQMVAKGLNLSCVTLVGVLDADMSLYVDSFRAGETTFSMLTQVIGRAGRGETAGRALIQTMTPEHRVITLAARQDYDAFYLMETELRQARRCPPFLDLFLLTVSGKEESHVMRGAVALRDDLRTALLESGMKEYQVLGPAPAPVLKINLRYRYRLSLRAKNDKQLRLVLSSVMKRFLKDSANRGLMCFADVNGYE